MDQRYFENVEPGDEIETPWDASPEAVAEFMATRRLASGVPPVEDGPEQVRPGFDRPIVPGSMSMAVLSRLVTDWMGPFGRLLSISATYRRPVYRDDRLRALALVTDAEESTAAEGGVDGGDGGDTGTVKLDVYLENERGERPLQGVAVVRLPRRP